MLQFEGVTLVAALLHQIRRGFAERSNNVAAPLVNQGELFYFYWPAISLPLIVNHYALTPTWDRRTVDQSRGRNSELHLGSYRNHTHSDVSPFYIIFCVYDAEVNVCYSTILK